MTPRVIAAASASRPLETSSNGFARRVSAIRRPAAITPPMPMATVIGSSQAWMRVTAGSVARFGEGIWTHQVAVFTTIQRMPSPIAWAMPPRMPPVTAPVTGAMTLVMMHAGLIKGSQGMSGSPFGGQKGVTGQGRDGGSCVGPVAFGRRDEPPVAVQPDDVKPAHH